MPFVDNITICDFVSGSLLNDGTRSQHSEFHEFSALTSDENFIGKNNSTMETRRYKEFRSKLPSNLKQTKADGATILNRFFWKFFCVMVIIMIITIACYS